MFWTRLRSRPSAWMVHLPVAAELVEVGDIERAEVHSSVWVTSCCDTPREYAFGAVDVGEQLRRVGAELGGDAGEAGLGLELLDQFVGALLQGGRPDPPRVLDHELEAARELRARDGRRPEGGHAGVLDLLHPRVRHRVMIALESSSGVVRLVNGSRTTNIVAKLGLSAWSTESFGRDGDCVGDAGRPAHDPFDAGHGVPRPSSDAESGSWNVADDAALVLRRHEARRQL